MKTVVLCMRFEMIPQLEHLNSFLQKDKRSRKRKTEINLTQEEEVKTESPLDP